MAISLPITVILAVKNEEANLSRCLEALKPAVRVIVVDSYSNDSTVEIARSYNAEVIQFDYSGGYPKKRQWVLDSMPIETEWVFLLDADEVVPDKLWEEIRSNIFSKNCSDAYLIKKGFHFLGRKLRYGGFSHSAVLLFRTGTARFEELDSRVDSGLDMEVHERVIVDGIVTKLKSPLLHEDFKGIQAYIDRHNKYSSWEAGVRYSKINDTEYGQKTIKAKAFGNSQERRRFFKTIAIRMPFEPMFWFIYHYYIRLGFLEGRRGLIASQIRASYISQSRAKLYELYLNSSSE